VAFSIAGDGYVVGSDDPMLLADFARWAEPLRAPIGPNVLRITMRTRGEVASCLELGDGKRLSYDAPEDLVPALEGLLYDRMRRPGRGLTVVHAAVAARGKRAVLFLGESGAGKSVLSLRLARRGWTYLSDDLAPLEGAARVLALPRPVTFAAEEIKAPLFREISRGLTTWESHYRTPEGTLRSSLHAMPAHAAESGAPFEIGAIYRLESRLGRAPLLHRMAGPEARAWLFAQRAMRHESVSRI
jgi:hypothetical protein